MGAAIHYWRFNRLNTQGKITVEIITEAESFIKQKCWDLAHQIPFSDQAMQHRLFSLLAQNPWEAELCLRCFISEQIKQACISLERRFGHHYQFNREDLFPLVLDDSLRVIKTKIVPQYVSMATKILEKFNPQKASLSTWTNRLVYSEERLTHFLLEKGLYLISDWAILNDTNSKQLERIFREFYHLNESYIRQSILLLEAYHQVYRQKRLADKREGKRGKCPPPTLNQLQQITELAHFAWKTEKTLSELQALGTQLREYRIVVKSKKSPQSSLENPDTRLKLEQQQLAQSTDILETETEDFLSLYRQQFLNSLTQSINITLAQWLEQKKGFKKEQFLKSLQLFHCQGLSMSKIASMVGLERQDQVTRLIKLKDFRADIRQKMLQNLRNQIFEIASSYTHPEQLLKQEKLIEIALEEQVDAMLEKAKAEASSAKNQPLKSLFAQSLCHYLDQLENLS